MKYRTVIELTCDATDRDEACNIAGEYLKGDLDFGVDMKCKTGSFHSHKAIKYVTTSLATVMVLFVSLAFFEPSVNLGEKVKNSINSSFSSTFTVTPELKTQNADGFKKEWAKKKDETVLDYLRN